MDGYELSYAYKDTSQFPKAYQKMATRVLPFVAADSKKYRQTFSFGFGVWLIAGRVRT